MTEFADIFASGLTTAVYVYGSVIMLAGYGLSSCRYGVLHRLRLRHGRRSASPEPRLRDGIRSD